MFASKPRPRKILQYCYWFLILGLAANFTPRLIKSVRAANVKIVPYTVTLQNYSVNSDGTSTPMAKMTVSVRSDGSRAIEVTQVIRDKPWAERILNFPSGLTSYIMEHSHQKSRTFDPSRKNIAATLPNPANDCEIPGKGQQVAGTEEIGSYRTEKIISGPITEWLALDYGCALIKDRAEWGDGQVTEKRLIFLIPGESASSLFDDPTGFEEVPPSKLFSTARSADQAASQDAYYYAHRPQ